METWLSRGDLRVRQLERAGEEARRELVDTCRDRELAELEPQIVALEQQEKAIRERMLEP